MIATNLAINSQRLILATLQSGGLSNYYQYITNSPIIEDSGLQYLSNKGIGGINANIQVLNTQVGTFNNTDDYIDTLVSAEGEPFDSIGINQFTIIAKSLPNPAGSIGMFVMCGDTGTDRGGISIAQSGQIAMIAANGANTFINLQTANVGDNDNAIVAVAYDGTQAVNEDRGRIYRNGVQLATTPTGTIPTSLSNTVGTFKIGVTHNAFFSDGKFYEIHIFNRALTTLEIQNYQNYINTRDCLFSTNFQDNDIFEVVNNAYNGQYLNGIVFNADSTFKASKSDFAKPQLLIKGGNKSLISENACVSFYDATKGTDIAINIDGTHFFKFNKKQVGGTFTPVSILQSNNNADKNGYSIVIDANERIDFYKYVSNTPTSIFNTANGIIKYNVYYEAKLVIASGNIELFIKGGEYTDWTSIGSVTDSTYTNFKYYGFASGLSKNELIHLNLDGEYADPSKYIDDTGSCSAKYYEKIASINSGVVIGDSTIATYKSATAVGDLIYSSNSYDNLSIAVVGDTIDEQEADWNSLSNKNLYNWIFIQIGLNDLDHAVATSTIIANLQAFINTVKNTKRPDAVIIISCPLLARQWLRDKYGTTNGDIAYQQLLDINEAIMGNGGSPITNVDYRNDYHVSLISDQDGYLKAEYEAAPADGVHPNTAGKTIIAQGLINILETINILPLVNIDKNGIPVIYNNCLWNTGNTFKQPSGDAGLFALSKAYTELDFQYGADADTPLEFSFDDLQVIKAYAKYIFNYETDYISRLKIPNQDIVGNDIIKLKVNYYHPDKNGSRNYVNIIFAGNSITKTLGNCGTTETYSAKLKALLEADTKTTVIETNKGVGGYQGSEMVTNFERDILPHVNPNYTNYCIFFEFVNDLANGATAQEAVDNMEAFAALCAANNIISIGMTAPNNSSNSVEPSNVIMRSNTTAYNHFIDLNSRMDSTIMDNVTYSCDGTHMTDAGVDYMVSWLNTEIQSLGIIPISVNKNNDVLIKNTQCIQFTSDSYNNAIQLPFALSTNVFTIAYRALEIGNTNTIFGSRDAAFDGILIYGGKFIYNSVSLNPTVDLMFNAMRNYAWTCDGTTLKCYIDGVFDSELDISNEGDINVTTNARIGSINDGAVSLEFNGEMSEFHILNVALDANQIKNVEANLTPANCLFSTYFNEGVGTEIKDRSTNGNHGTILGSNIDNILWNNFRDDIFPAHIICGYTLFEQIADPNIKFRAPYDILGNPTVTSKSGYTKIAEIPPKVISETNNTYLGIEYSDWSALEKTYAEIYAEFENIPPKEDFQIDNSGECIKNIASQPLQAYQVIEGNYQTTDGKYLVIKNF